MAAFAWNVENTWGAKTILGVGVIRGLILSVEGNREPFHTRAQRPFFRKKDEGRVKERCGRMKRGSGMKGRDESAVEQISYASSS
jgi:hypothetical protein